MTRVPTTDPGTDACRVAIRWEETATIYNTCTFASYEYVARIELKGRETEMGLSQSGQM